MVSYRFIPLPQVRAFHAVAMHGSFSAAAEALSVSQPTVTAHVKDLEERFGVELFFRHPRGASLTDVAQGLLPIVQRIHTNQQEVFEFLAAVQGQLTGSMRVGTYGPFEAIDIVAAFKEKWPNITVSIKLGNSAELQEDILNHRLDVGVFGRSELHAELHRLPYKIANLVVIVAKAHPWSERESVSIAELADQRIIVREQGAELRQVFDSLAWKAKLSADNIIEIGSREGVLAMVAQNLGVATIFDEGLIPGEYFTKLQILDEPVINNIDVLCLKQRSNNRNIKAFLDVAEGLQSGSPA